MGYIIIPQSVSVDGLSIQTNASGQIETVNTPRVLGTDLTGGSTTSTTATKISSVDNIINVQSFIIIQINYKAGGRYYSSYSRRPQLDIRIGETGSEASVTDSPFTNLIYTPDTTGAGICEKKGTLTYYYAPTTAEKTNGFNVHVYANQVESGSPPLTDSIEVFQTIVSGQ